ncbi:MAG: hypothetical protein V1750_04645, partial [Acidobacteriota bacterium]
MPTNPLRKIATIWLAIALVAALVAVGPFLAGDGARSGWYLMSALAGFLALAGLIAAAVYRGRAAALDRLLAGEGLIAHWSYRPEEWQCYLREEDAEDVAERTALFWVIAGIALVIGSVFLVFAGAGGGVRLRSDARAHRHHRP